MSELPKFKYNPDPVKLGIIIKKKIKCSICKEERSYLYEGPFYSIKNVKNICPWCIKSGEAAKMHDGEFQDSDSCEPVDKEEYTEELITRTPGYSGWQQEQWLSHCGDYCAIVGYVGWKEIEHLKDELENDLNQIKNEYRLSQDDLENMLVDGGGMQGYLFKCLHCGKHRLAVDMD